MVVRYEATGGTKNVTSTNQSNEESEPAAEG